MGIIVLPNGLDVPFPRRLFAAMADYAIRQGREERLWRMLHQRFDGAGCFLDLAELPGDELLAFKLGISSLVEHLDTVDEFAGFEARGTLAALKQIERSFAT